MHIAFVIGSVEFSGAERVLMTLAHSFSGRGHAVDIILTESSIPTDSSSIRYYSVPVCNGGRIQRVTARLRSLRCLLKKVNPDVVVSFGYHNNVNTALAMVRSSIPVVVCERTNPEFHPAGYGPRLLRRLLYPLASRCVFQTQSILEQFSRRIVSKSRVIPNPVMNVSHPVVPNFVENAEGDILTLITMSRLSDSDKNISLLIKAFGTVQPSFPKWRLEIYGVGPDRGLLEEVIERMDVGGFVHLVGGTDAPLDVMRSATAFALTSRTEGMPNALIEAMSVGLPCLATDCSGGGARDLIDDRVNGLLVRNDSLPELKSALVALMSDGHLRGRLGHSALRINERLSLDNVLGKWMGMFDDIITTE